MKIIFNLILMVKIQKTICYWRKLKQYGEHFKSCKKLESCEHLISEKNTFLNNRFYNILLLSHFVLEKVTNKSSLA